MNLHIQLFILVVLGASFLTSPQSLAQGTPPSESEGGKVIHNFDSGLQYIKGDFKWTTWFYGERLFDQDKVASWRRVRQGMEFDLPRFSETLRPAFVYEADFTNNDFFKQNPSRRVFENLYVSIQDVEDPGNFRILFGENTHILSREDNLSSGNLPTINRSLILEEHGSVNSFGTQWGFEFQKRVADGTTLFASAQDNRGSLNQTDPQWTIGNSLAVKLAGPLMTFAESNRHLNYGIGFDRTGNLSGKTFNLISAIGGAPIGGTDANGTKWSSEVDLTWVSTFANMTYSLESEGLASTFSRTGTEVWGGYLQGQISLWDTYRGGEFTPFLRYDFVRLSREGFSGDAYQEVVRSGVNYNLPFLMKLVNLRFEHAHNYLSGPNSFVTQPGGLDEFRAEIRISMTRYSRF